VTWRIFIIVARKSLQIFAVTFLGVLFLNAVYISIFGYSFGWWVASILFVVTLSISIFLASRDIKKRKRGV